MKIFKIIVAIVFIALAAWVLPKIKTFFKLDACLDRGGRWNYELNKCDSCESAKITAPWEFDKVDGSRLVFKGGKTFETNLFELEYIGQVSAENKAPYLIFSGRDCKECDANISIYIHSPSDGKLDIGQGQNSYRYPGTEKDYETDTVLCVSRAFFGQVLNDIKGVIWYENRLLRTGRMGLFVYLARIEKGSLSDTSYEFNGRLDETITLLNIGQCSEIPGRQYTGEP